VATESSSPTERDVGAACVDIVRDLIRIPSESGEPTATSSPPEKGVTDYIERYLGSFSVPVGRQQVFSGRDNLIINLPAPGRPKILVTAHMDTVGAGGMDDPFAATAINGEIYGRGACDDKGSLAVLLDLLPHLNRFPHVQ